MLFKHQDWFHEWLTVSPERWKAFRSQISFQSESGLACGGCKIQDSSLSHMIISIEAAALRSTTNWTLESFAHFGQHCTNYRNIQFFSHVTVFISNKLNTCWNNVMAQSKAQDSDSELKPLTSALRNLQRTSTAEIVFAFPQCRCVYSRYVTRNLLQALVEISRVHIDIVNGF